MENTSKCDGRRAMPQRICDDKQRQAKCRDDQHGTEG